MPEVQDIFRIYGEAYRKNHRLAGVQDKAFRAILNCRTSVLGAHVDKCDNCGYEQISYNSCRNRHCPKCQSFAKEQWLEKQRQNLLNTNYFHVVFTVPDNLSLIFYQNQAQMYGLLFKAASETLLELCADRKYLGAVPGITAVLHTWGQKLNYHPHLHCVVTGGGLSNGSTWRDSGKKFFLPVKVISKKFRGKFLYHLRHETFKSSPEKLDNIRKILPDLYKKGWVVYCKPPFGGPEKVLDYLARYTHRVAISNNRIIKLDKDGKILFGWKDYKDNCRMKITSLSAEEFIRRFLMHILPSGFRKIRHYGLFASRNKNVRLSLCRKLTKTIRKPAAQISALEKLKAALGEDFNLCPCCGIGHLCREPPIQSN
jgi:predicted Zn-ribbon and HTH transcriptional regulator